MLGDLTEAFFNRYLAKLFSLLLPPLVRHGIGLESHAQNVLVRVNTTSKEITGFVVRDFGGMKIHSPTFSRTRIDLSSIPPGASAFVDDIHKVWHKVYHALIQMHVGHLLYMLDLESHGGWPIVREELERVLDPLGDPDGRAVHEAFTNKTMAFKCFMEMRLRNIYRDVSLSFSFPLINLCFLPKAWVSRFKRLMVNSIMRESCRIFSSGICSHKMTFRLRFRFHSAKRSHEAPRITAVVFEPPLRRIQPI